MSFHMRFLSGGLRRSGDPQVVETVVVLCRPRGRAGIAWRRLT